MKRNLLLSVFAVCAIALLFSMSGSAQNNRVAASSTKDLYVISAKAGGVNFVEGKVSVDKLNNRSGLLLKGDNLQAGETVSTGANGKAEILLNPGSYIRLAENTSFEFLNTSLDDLQIKLNRGSAMFEVIADNELKIVAKTPKASFDVIKSGVYRLDVAADGTGKIEVWKGKALAGNSQKEIKGGQAAVVDGDQIALEKFDRGDKDTLEIWSKSRAKELAKLNSQLQAQSMRNTLINSFMGRSWNMYDAFGLWVYNPFSMSYCFLPFGYDWYSPYGYGYGRDIWYYRLPVVIYNQPPPTTNRNPIFKSNKGLIRGTATNSEGARVIPPFQRVQKDIGRDPVQREERPVRVFGGRQSAPVMVAPPTIPTLNGRKGN